MAGRESAAKNFLVTGAVAIVCSFAVSVTAVGLRERREANQDLDRMRHILAVAGLYDPSVPVSRGFARVEPRWIDLETGEYVPAGEVDLAAAKALGPAVDIAGIEKRERYVQVYLVRDLGRVSQIVLPVRGQGWSMLHGFIALERDLTTVHGITFHEHEESPGLGAEVDSPGWRSRWRGKRIYGAGGDVELRLVKGGAAAGAPHEVDAITGATITTEGVQNLVRFWFGELGYRRYLRTLEQKGVDHG